MINTFITYPNKCVSSKAIDYLTKSTQSYNNLELDVARYFNASPTFLAQEFKITHEGYPTQQP